METYSKNKIGGVYTLPEFMRRLGEAPANSDNATHIEQWVRDCESHEWCGTKEEAKAGETPYLTTLRLCADGWLAGVRMMDKVSGQIQAPTPKIIRRMSRWQREGSEVDMQRIWAGDLDNAFRGTFKAPGCGPARVRILIDSIASGGVNAETMRWRGVGALKLADLLTEAGYAVQMESVFEGMCGSTDTEYKLRVVVKEYADPADLPALAATTAMPAFFRALQHCWGTVTAQKPRHNVGYQVRDANPANFADGDDHCAVVMFGQDITDAAAASKRVTDAVARLDAEAGE